MQDYKFTHLERMINVKSVITSFNAVRKKNFYFAGEMHNFWEMVYVVSGKAMATADEKVLSLSEGNLLFHKPMEFHRIWSTENESPQLCIISFDAEGEGMSALENKLLKLSPIEGERFVSIASDFKKIIRAFNAVDYYEQNHFKLLANKTVAKFEALLLELIDREARPAEAKSSYISQYEYIVRIMNEHSREALCQEDIARLCSLSPSNLKKIFHMYSDIGVMRYFTSIKLRRAMSLLSEGASIQSVSDELGFSSPSYFHSVFKKELGMTPKEYLRKNTPSDTQKTFA